MLPSSWNAIVNRFPKSARNALLRAMRANQIAFYKRNTVQLMQFTSMMQDNECHSAAPVGGPRKHLDLTKKFVHDD